MKKYLITLFSIFLALLLFILTDENHNSVSAHAEGTEKGYSGSPGDSANCTYCHTGTASSQNDLITSDIPVTGYIPGTTYTIAASIAATGVVKFGFEVSAQNITGSKRGSLQVTNATQTQLVGNGKYITHQLAGTPGIGGNKTWSFNWVAPFAGSGDVTFYGAFNATNNDDTEEGDAVTLSQMLVHENITTAVHEPISERFVKVFPNPSSAWLNITPLPGKFISTISIFDLRGKKVNEETVISNDAITLDIRSMEAGLYVLMVHVDNKVVIRKIVVL